MPEFSIGLVSFLLAIAFPAFYLIGYGARHFDSYLKGGNPPTDRVKAYLIIGIIFGFAAGSFIQPVWDKGSECRDFGQNVIECMLPAR